MALQARRVCVYDKARRARTQSQIRATLACGFAARPRGPTIAPRQASAKPQPACGFALARGPTPLRRAKRARSRKRVIARCADRAGYDAGQRRAGRRFR